MQPYEELPSGKKIMRQLDREGQIAMEMQIYGGQPGEIDIGISFGFHAGAKTSETYFLQNAPVSREMYEEARAQYPDMPAADADVEDTFATLENEIQARQQQLAREHIPDPQQAAEHDAFCRSLLEAGQTAEARTWIESPNHTLGELPHSQSLKLVEKLFQLGAQQLHVCNIDCYEDDQENSGHLVVELPDDPQAREALLGEVNRRASLEGYDGDYDDGQRYAYIKLD